MVILLAAWGVPFGSAQGKVAEAQQQESQTAQQPSQPAQQTQQASGRQQSQKQEDALAEAARRTRENKAQQPKATKVFDNDNLPKEGSISVIGEGKAAGNETATSPKPESPTAEGAGESKPAGGGTTGADEQQKAKLGKELADAKEHLQSEMTDLDLATRKLALDQQSYYGKPNFAADETGAAALKIEEAVVASKKQEVADAQKKVDDLTEKLKDLGSDSEKPSTPQ
jgi:hypothetical protein